MKKVLQYARVRGLKSHRKTMSVEEIMDYLDKQ